MNMRPLYLFVFLSPLLFSACDQIRDFCPDCRERPGIIVSNEAGPQPLSCDWTGAAPSTVASTLLLGNDSLLIQSDSVYQALEQALAADVELGSCNEFQFFPIDFTQFDVVSMPLSFGGCSFSICPQVEEDVANQRYLYTVTVKQCGGCYQAFNGRVWNVVPKMPEGYTIQFEVDLQ